MKGLQVLSFTVMLNLPARVSGAVVRACCARRRWAGRHDIPAAASLSIS